MGRAAAKRAKRDAARNARGLAGRTPISQRRRVRVNNERVVTRTEKDNRTAAVMTRLGLFMP